MRRDRRGFTLLELIFAIGLLTFVVIKLTIVLSEAREVHSRETAAMTLEDRAREILDRVSYALIGADAGTLDPAASFPFFAHGLEYKISLGIEDGETVWSDVEYIGLAEGSPELRWGRHMGEPDEEIVVWCRNVAELIEDELANGADDNGNEMADETGLTFTMVGDTVTILLTLETAGDAGGNPQCTVETKVTCRN
ncbi:MAG: type II secretion system protein [Planctomycetota bacterium]